MLISYTHSHKKVVVDCSPTCIILNFDNQYYATNLNQSTAKSLWKAELGPAQTQLVVIIIILRWLGYSSTLTRWASQNH